MIHVATLKDLAELTARLRKETGMAYRVLAKDAGINPGTLMQMEHGRHWPCLATFGRLLQWHGETATVGWDPNGKGNVENDYSRGTGQ